MQFLLTNAVDLNGLLIALKNFLSAHGWTVLADGTGGGGLTLEMTNANGHSFAFSSSTNGEFDWSTGVSVAFNDRLLKCQFQKSNIGLAAGYTTREMITNDMNGPFTNIWLFTDDAATYCHCVMQTGNARFNHFSFGDLNDKGLHAIVVPYAMGLYYRYWREGLNYLTGNLPFNTPSHGAHVVGFFCEGANTETVAATGQAIRLGLPNGLVDPALGFTAGAIEAPMLRPTSARYCRVDPSGNNVGHFLDFLFQYDNQGYTGGVPIFPATAIVRNVANTAHTIIGEFPNIGQVDMDGLSPAQELTFAGDTWIVFPLKQQGTFEATNAGINPQPMCNSWKQGIAIKKVGA